MLATISKLVTGASKAVCHAAGSVLPEFTKAVVPVVTDSVKASSSATAGLASQIVGKSSLRFGKEAAEMFLQAHEKVTMAAFEQIVPVFDEPYKAMLKAVHSSASTPIMAGNGVVIQSQIASAASGSEMASAVVPAISTQAANVKGLEGLTLPSEFN